MSKVIIMRGIQGSGKSTKARELISGVLDGPCVCEYLPQGSIVSADHYWINSEGEYVFIPEKIGDAHRDCFAKFHEACSNADAEVHDSDHTIIVDNTNIELHEIAPYLSVAQYFNLDIEIVNVDADLDVCLSRQIHNVPEGIVKNKYKRFQSVRLPFQWKEFAITAK